MFHGCHAGLLFCGLCICSTHPGLGKKKFFMDDAFLFGTPRAIKLGLELIEKLEPISGLELKWTKMSVHAPNASSAKLCRELLPSEIQVIENENPNFVSLKTPIGEDEFVEKYLEEKLTLLRRDISALSEMKHLFESFTLLRSCAPACKVTHLMRTIDANYTPKATRKVHR